MKSLDEYPEFLTSAQLVELGFFRSKGCVYMARVKGTGPDFIKLKKKILYPKKALIEFVNKYMTKGDANLSKFETANKLQPKQEEPQPEKPYRTFEEKTVCY